MNTIDKHWHGTEYNDCEHLGITIKRAETGNLHAHCVAIHHLTRDENKGNHNLFLDVIDEFGKRIKLATLKGDNNGIRLIAKIDKPDNEFGTNFSLYSQDTVSCWVDEVPGIGKVVSDTVSGFHTRWGGDIVGGNDYGHNSYYVIFQLTTDAPDPIPPNPTYEQGLKDGVKFAKHKLTEALDRLG